MKGTGRKDVKAQGTISDKEWQSIQRRAAKANPKLADRTSKESARRASRDIKNFDNRNNC